MWQGLPPRCTGMMARVRGVMRRSTSAGSRLNVSRSTSAKTGMAFWARMGITVPMSVMGAVMISSPGSGSMAPTATWMADVPEVEAVQWRAP